MALVNYLNSVTNRQTRSGADVEMEFECLKCLKASLSTQVCQLPIRFSMLRADSAAQLGAIDAMSRPQIPNAICASLVSPHTPCRRIAAEMLLFFCTFDENARERKGLALVLSSFDHVEQVINSAILDVANKVGKFDMWLRQLEAVIDGRGRMGSMVGMSKDFKEAMDVHEYCVSTDCDPCARDLAKDQSVMLFLAVSLITTSPQLRSRCSVRAQLETAGLLQIFDKVRPWKEPRIQDLMIQYEQEADADRKELMEEQQQTLLHSMRAPEDVFRALLQNTRGTKASAYLLDAMRHMLLIQQGHDFVRFFQLIDRLVVSIVTSDTPEMNHDFSRAFGISVTHLIGKFVEQDRIEQANEEIKALKSALSRMDREKADMMEEMAGGNDGLVGQLKAQVTELEEKLRKSRAATDALRDQLEGSKRDYETRIADLELIIQELFNMLRETNHLDAVSSMDQGPINRMQLIRDLREKWHRKKTIEKLEGGDGKKTQAEDEELGEVLEAEKVVMGRATGEEVPTTRRKTALSGSQFLDAADEDVRAHIEDALIKGADHIVSQRKGYN